MGFSTRQPFQRTLATPDDEEEAPSAHSPPATLKVVTHRPAEAEVAKPVAAKSEIVPVEEKPWKRPTLAEDFRTYQRAPDPTVAGPVTGRRVAAFDDLLLSFVMRIGGLPLREGFDLMQRALELRNGVAKAHGMVRLLSDPACRRPGSKGLPQALLDTSFTVRGNLCIRLAIDKSKGGEFRFDPRSRGVLSDKIDRVLFLRDVEGLAGRELSMFGGRSTPYGAYRSDLVELVIAAHREIYEIAAQSLACTTTDEPFARFDAEGLLVLDLEDGVTLALQERLISLVPDESSAKSALKAFSASYPRVSPEDFVAECRRLDAEGLEGEDAVGRLAMLGMEISPIRGPGYSKGARKFKVGPERLEEAAAIVERALDLSSPGWNDRAKEADLQPEAAPVPRA